MNKQEEQKEYGMNYGVISELRHLRREEQIWLEIKLEIGPFLDWADFYGALEGVKANLQHTVEDSLESRELLEIMRKK